MNLIIEQKDYTFSSEKAYIINDMAGEQSGFKSK